MVLIEPGLSILRWNGGSECYFSRWEAHIFIVFDLDGTLADCSHRLHHIEKFDLDCCHAGKIDWDTFYRACIDDAPIWPIINTLIAFRAAGAKVEIWTGRSDLVETETRQWFLRHGISHVPMRMRPHGNHSPDYKMKRDWLHEGGARPDLVFEDRSRVVQMFREEGIRVCQVDTGNF